LTLFPCFFSNKMTQITRSIRQVKIKNKQLLLIQKLNVHQPMSMLIVNKKMKANGLHKVVNKLIIVTKTKAKRKHQTVINKKQQQQQQQLHQTEKMHQKNEQLKFHHHHQVKIIPRLQIKLKLILNQQQLSMLRLYLQQYKHRLSPLKFVN